MFTIACYLVIGLGLGFGLGLHNSVLLVKLLFTRICATLGCKCHEPELNPYFFAEYVPKY